jgi:epoxyqueuosine reductase
MKLLLHICCAPCAISPVETLRSEGFEVMGYFYRHNIHPYTECVKRENTLKKYAEDIGLGVIWSQGYDLEGFIRNTAFRENQRCLYCYHDRLTKTAEIAKHGKFDCFSTTLLYSIYQQHEAIRSIGESLAESMGINFYYKDFRIGWKYGVDTSKSLEMYRQPYCGCIFSEKERYFKNRLTTEG